MINIHKLLNVQVIRIVLKSEKRQRQCSAQEKTYLWQLSLLA